MSERIEESLSRFGARARVAGLAGLVLLVLGVLPGVEGWWVRFHRALLLAFLFWLGPSLGSLALLMLHSVTGGRWGYAVRRVLQAAARTLPVLAVAFVPIFLWPDALYRWARPEAVAGNPLLEHKAPYLDVGFFRFRALLYFGAWLLLVWGISRLARTFEERPTERNAHRLRALGAPGIGVFGLTLTFASVDWSMSLEPEWFSTMYGVLFIVGYGLAALAFAIAFGGWLARREPVASHVGANAFHDLGNLMLAFVMLWAYVSFSQFLIVWSGNLAEETPWYVHRMGHGWQALALLLVLFHFAVPFLLLLSRRTKRSRGTLAALACALLGIRFLDLYWTTGAAFHDSPLNAGLVAELGAVLALGGLWTGVFLGRLRSGELYCDPPAELAPATEGTSTASTHP